MEAVAARPKIFMGLALVHFQKYWLLKSFAQQVLVTIFPYFNFKKTLFTNNVGNIWFPCRKYFLEKIVYKNMQFQTILLLYKRCVNEKKT